MHAVADGLTLAYMTYRGTSISAGSAISADARGIAWITGGFRHPISRSSLTS
jgi:hypothetical protein